MRWDEAELRLAQFAERGGSTDLVHRRQHSFEHGDQKKTPATAACGAASMDARQPILVPASSERIMAGDRLLLLGAHNKIRDFRTFVWH